MCKTFGLVMAGVVIAVCLSARAHATDLVLTTGGRVTIELISSEADLHDTLALVSPTAAIVSSGCQIEPDPFSGLKLVSEKISQHGCRVELDADPSTPGIQEFAAGTTLSFNLCAQDGNNPGNCKDVWSSDPALNSDNYDHVITTPLHTSDYPGQIFQLAWEDLPNGGDKDFNDLIAVVRVNVDTDEDGLWDDWEQFGIDVDGDGVVDLDLPALGANRLHKDIFLEIDYMDCNLAGGDCAPGDTHTHQPPAAVINAVVQAFADSPATNPDGTTGINLHIDVSNAIPHQNQLVVPGADCGNPPPGGSIGSFDAVKSDPANFGPNNPRRYAYHYVLFTHQQTNSSTTSGCSELPGNDVQVSLGGWNYFCSGGPNAGQFCPASRGGVDCGVGTCAGAGDIDGDGVADQDVGTIQQQAGTLMHELGHNLDLHHGGNDELNRKPNYLSIMSYRFQTTGIPPTDPDGTGPLTGRLDYSGVALASLNESILNENTGIGDGTDNTRYACPASVGGVRTGAGTGAIDWNCNNNSTNTNVSSDINGDGSLSTLNGFDDWDNIKFDFQNTGDFGDGEHSFGAETVELDFPAHLVNLNHPPVADAGPDQTIECTGPSGAEVTLDGSGSSDPDGDNLTYTWTGPFGTLTGMVVHPVLSLGTQVVELTVSDGNGTLGTSTDSLVVTVRDTTPPSLSVNLSPNVLWPPDHKMDSITATINVSDVCDPSPKVTLLSVTSNEPDNGLGDGDTPQDIQNATLGTDDRSFSLRAERAGVGFGRVYTVTYQSADASGNTTSVWKRVTVPH